MFAGMARALEALKGGYGQISEFRRRNPADFWHNLLFASFWLTIALFPISYGWRDVAPPVCLAFLLIYYRHAWRESVLYRFRLKWLFYCAAAMVAIGVVFSTNPLSSLMHAGRGIDQCYLLPFIAMECCRDGRELRNLAWACAVACFWQGLDGLWQAHTGRDFILGYELNKGRLTGSIGDYEVGNYLALTLVPAFGLWFVLRKRLGPWSGAFAFLAIFWPAFFLFQGAASRSGILAIAGALCLWAIMAHGWLNWRVLLYPGLAFLAFALMQPARLDPGLVANDGRWSLWRLGWAVFREHPVFGAGAGQYNAVFRSLGLVPEHDEITISHPHNLYLDILYAHGLVGFTLGMIFIAGFLVWGWRRIEPRLRLESTLDENGGYWHLAAWFWLGYAAWLINGIFGHDFYRIWWLDLAMISLGVMIGAIVNGVQREKGRG